MGFIPFIVLVALAAFVFGVMYGFFLGGAAVSGATQTGDWTKVGEVAAGIGAAAAFGVVAADMVAALAVIGLVGTPLAVVAFVAVGLAAYAGEQLGPTIFSGVKKIADGVGNWFQKALEALSPIVLDLDGDGIETTKQNGGILFDHQADGVKEGTGWVGKDDGLLVLDRNGNGEIDSGRELFGTNTQLANGALAVNGFEALQELDSNHDGRLDASDTQWSQLKVWKDTNSNGVTDNGELIAMSAVGGMGIRQIDLAYQAANERNANGVEFVILLRDYRRAA